MKLSVCMIAKNEERVLEGCLKALKPLGAELVFTDTGSEDNTLRIAKAYADKVLSFPWQEDFSAARNFCIRHASNDLVLSLDCDEILNWEAMGNPSPAELGKRLFAEANAYPGALGRITLIGQIGTDDSRQESKIIVRRLFDRRVFHFEGAIHEQLVRKDGKKHASYPTSLIFTHLGYAGNLEERRKKAERNNRMLFAERKKHPRDGYLDYQIGKSYILMEENEKALTYLASALEKEYDDTAEFVDDLLFCYGTLALQQGKAGEALYLEGQREHHGDSADFATLLGQIYAANGLWEKALEEFSRALDYPQSEYRGGNTWLPLFYSGIIYDAIGDKEMAGECLKASADMGYEPAAKEWEKLFT